MEQGKAVVKLITLAQFKEDVSPAEIEHLIKGYANLVNLIPSLKDFAWGTNIDIHNGKAHGYTHVFQLIFEDSKGVQEYLVDPHHIAFSNILLPKLKQFLAIDFIPTKVLQ